MSPTGGENVRPHTEMTKMSRRDKNKFVKQYKKKKNVYAWSKQELRFPTLCQHVHCLCVCLFVLWCLS